MSQSRIDALTKMLAGDPSNVMVRYGLANEYWKMANYEAVIEQLTAYLKATDDQGAGYRMLGQAYHKLGNLAEARAAWRAGQTAAENHGHPTMADEISQMIEALD